MKRLSTKLRKKFKNSPDWHEGIYYSFSKEEISELEKATLEVNKLALKALKHVFDKKLFQEFNIPNHLIPIIKQSWITNEKPIISQFDFLFDGTNIPKLCDINTDYYNNLYESAELQKSWKQDKFEKNLQFNSLKEHLTTRFNSIKKIVKSDILYFTGAYNINNYATLTYIKQIADEVGIKTQEIPINELTFENKKLIHNKKELKFIYKTLPWEWADPLLLKADNIIWFEPAWTNLLSNKALLAIMYELFPNNEYLLPTYLVPNKLNSFVKKPLYGRDGSNISIHNNSKITWTGGSYTNSGFIYQKYHQIKQFDSFCPIIRSFIINDEFSAIGIKESQYPINNNLSNFTPHIIES